MAAGRRRSILTASLTSGLTTDTGGSVQESERNDGGLVACLIIRALAGTGPSITGKIQHTAADASVADGAAEWLDLLTFTAQTANGAQIQSTLTPYFPRLRALVTRGGTAVTALTYDVVLC